MYAREKKKRKNQLHEKSSIFSTTGLSESRRFDPPHTSP
jgi:hypothetical protein